MPKAIYLEELDNRYKDRDIFYKNIEQTIKENNMNKVQSGPLQGYDSLLDQMYEFQIVKENHPNLRNDIKHKLQKQYPTVKDFWFTETELEITTQNHTFRISRYGEPIENLKPIHICNNQEMPETVEDFLAMKEQTQKDYNECNEAMQYMAKLYDIGK